jgi:NADPH:quinone reductase-like Zn-dependent oxidoreductase
VRGLGADTVIEYRAQDFEQLLGGYDLVLDSLGGENLEKSLRVLRPGGKAISIAGPPDAATARQLGVNAVVRLAVIAMSAGIRRRARKLGVAYEFLFMRASGAQLGEIAKLIDGGAIRPILGTTASFEELPEALAALERGGIRGKAVITNP